MLAVLCLLVCLVTCFSNTVGVLDSAADGTACHHGDQVYTLGDQWTLPGYCRWFLCEENNLIVEKGCPDYELLEGCYMSEYDSTQNYPDCCPKLNCHQQEEIALQDWVDH